ncbi:MAG: phospho-N-acetylmuramoyl-pentapeptide-transferase [Bacteroidetes bacterium]|nr:phospho-N-acetylmuramoyl-pentapeptide-transferase [Bacteroidota bacterium]
MFYFLFEYLKDHYGLPGGGVFQYISFRTSMAVILSLLITVVFGKNLILKLQRLQVKETIRDLGLEGEKQKIGTPTMGGLIILSAIIIPTLLFAKFTNVYIILMLVCTVWLGLIGFLDDYIKVFKNDKKGLAGKFKILGQVVLGVVVGATLFYNKNVVTGQFISPKEAIALNVDTTSLKREVINGNTYYVRTQHSVKTTIPFVKTHEFNYEKLISWFCNDCHSFAWLIFIPIVIFIITAVSNGANITDGIDGLATGTSAIIGAVLGIFAYVSGNKVFSEYLNIMYIPNTGELLIFAGAFVGATVGFLWYNSFPAQVFMGDTGSLPLGGIIAAFAIMVRKELLIPILCGIFLVENLSVMLQVGVFKFRKRKYGLEYARANRLFKMSPLHHHYQKSGYHESKIVTRFWIIGIMLAIICFITLKLR